MPRLLLCLLLCALCLPGCDSGEPGGVPRSDYEGDLGEAIVRHLIKNLPDPAPGIPKSYCIVTGRALDTTSTEFARRFADLKLRFISGDVLLVTEPDNAVVDPETRLAPYVLQLAHIKPSGPAAWTAEVGWSYKKTFEKLRCEITRQNGEFVVTNGARLEGNYQPPPAARP